MIIDKTQAKDICQKALSYVSGGQGEIMLFQYFSPLTRFANNVIHQNLDVSNIAVSLRVDVGDRSGRATSNRTDDESLQKLARQATQAASAITIDQGLPPMVGPQSYRALDSYIERTVAVEPEQRADMVGQAVELAKTKGVLLAGLASNVAFMRAMANTKGLFAYHCQSHCSLEVTARDGLAAGRVARSYRDIAELEPMAIAAAAIEKCLESKNPRELEPGEYTVVLEPEAVTTPLQFLAWLSFGAQAVQENLSCLTGKLGEKLMGDNITIADDAYNPLMVAAEPFDYEGLPRQAVTIIDRGVAKTPVYDQKTAAKEGKTSTGHGFPQPNTFGPFPQNLALSPGTATLEQMITSTKRGVLVTRFWYNRVVDRKIPIITGMTRDGTFLIEDGEAVCGVKNMRFNQDLIEFFNNVEMIGPLEGQDNMAVPPLKVNKFHFTGRTE
ncbi:MAG: TldD/PmbA family protein [Candidatus Edwardsbacteria bacterium]|nr:TldD/PmbA family protein [Candidatus Edwardsbacteria bacterium]